MADTEDLKGRIESLEAAHDRIPKVLRLLLGLDPESQKQADENWKNALDSKQLIKALERHLESAKSLVTTAIFLAVFFLWTGLSETPGHSVEVAILGIKGVPYETAFFVAALCFLVINAQVAERFSRIAAILRSVKKEQLPEALTVLMSHPWIFNPFNYFGATFASRLNSAKGYGLLITVWWACNSSLTAFTNSLGPKEQIATFTFFAIGLFSMGTINQVMIEMVTLSKEEHPVLSGRLEQSLPMRQALAFAGIVAGGFLAAMVIASRA